MDKDNLTLFSPEEMPATDEKKEVERVNILQDNLIYLMEKKGVLLSQIVKETMIPMTTIYCWYRGTVDAQKLDINVKELASYFEVSIDALAFENMRENDSFEKFIDNDFKNQ